MDFQSVINDVKGRVETLSAQGQKAAQLSLDTLKKGTTIVVEGFQSLVNDQAAVAKDIYASAKSGFEKAKTDGIKAVAAAPISYLPPRQKLVDAFNSTKSLVTKTGDELYQTVKSGLSSVQAEFSGEVEKVENTVKAAAKTTVRKVKKAAASAKKAAS